MYSNYVMALRRIWYLFLIFLCSSLYCVDGQTNAIKKSISKCYNESALPGIRVADYRPPSNLNILIELIRKLEESNPSKTTRDLSIMILQRLRQDGIKQTEKLADTKYGLPFMPRRLEAYLSTLILDKYLPSSQSELNTKGLDDYELCSLHYSISSTIDNAIRNDESKTCRQSARYTSRWRRGATTKPVHTVKDIETVVEGVDGFGHALGSADTEVSQCPIELGVVQTNYGAIKPGLVLAGIAAGLDNQQVEGCDNRYAATLAGELAETALAQGSDTIQVGAAGGWNSTLSPKYYFLQKRQYLQFTDSEIRGAVDGLYMAMKVAEWRGKFPNLKISQILDTYYSPHQKGLFATDFNACNRNKLYTAITSTEAVKTQVKCIMKPLGEVAQYKLSIYDNMYDNLKDSTVDSFSAYFPQMSTGDVNCINNDITIERGASDLMVFIDANWNYDVIQPIMSSILDSIDVNRFGSRYTIFFGTDGRNITTTRTSYLLEFHEFYNRSVHEKASRGFDFTKIYQIVEDQVKSKLNNNTYTGNEATVVLLMPKNTPNDNERSFLEQKKQNFKKYLPDISVIVLGSGSSNDYGSALINPSKDFIQLIDSSSDNDLKIVAGNAAERIINSPRALVNPNCKSDFSGTSSTFQLVSYAEVGGVNYYKISPNYFFTGGDNRNLKVTENRYGSIEVCISRDQPKPNNQSSSQCETIRGQDKSFSLSGYCGGSVQDCAPIYLSVAGKSSDGYKCTDYYCRYPNNIKYTISMENVGCASGTFRILPSVILITVLYLICKFYH